MSILQAAGVDYGQHFGEIDAGIRERELTGPLNELIA